MLNIKSFVPVLMAVALSSCGESKPAEDQPAKDQQNATSVIEQCKNFKMDQLIGFDEQAEPTQCKPVNTFNLVAFKCEVSKNAFGAESDAAHIENETHSIFAYTTEQACNAGREAYASNGP